MIEERAMLISILVGIIVMSIILFSQYYQMIKKGNMSIVGSGFSREILFSSKVTVIAYLMQLNTLSTVGFIILVYIIIVKELERIVSK